VGTAVSPRGVLPDRARSDGLRAQTPSDLGPILDATARAAYRRRIGDLQQEIEEATDWGDMERAARAKHELQFLTEQLAAAVGLHGRDRVGTSTPERARTSVTKAIHRAIAKIGESDPSLLRHLENAVRTGAFCSYRPEDTRVTWLS
jgi:hypothetical protein